MVLLPVKSVWGWTGEGVGVAALVGETSSTLQLIDCMCFKNTDIFLYRKIVFLKINKKQIITL